MHLKSFVLRGFKTFADKTSFDFEPYGITAIVGPNGCGKSNTVDAFRFVLGEGAYSEIRVKNLTDVIFAGTQKRKPLSMSEVSIVLDNADQKLPLEFSEISIRRRTFRDGQSEFLINNNPARLKDIKDLFLDTGISEDSLSIIGQGKVDAILSSQPEERRAIFEEIAGIKKYKNRKIEAERKLILAEQNLLRISDLMNEIGDKLSVLEFQSKAAEEYIGIKEKLKQAELALSRKLLQGLLEKSGALRQEIDNFEKREDERNRQAQILEGEKQNLKEKIRNLEADLENAHQDIEDIKEKIENERSSIIIEQQRFLFEQKNRLREIEQEERFAEWEISQTNKQLEQLDAKLKGLENTVSKSEIGHPQVYPELKEFLALSKKLLGLTYGLIGAIHNVDAKDPSHDARISEVLSKEIAELKHQQGILDETVQDKNGRLEEIRSKIDILRAELSDLEEAEKNSSAQLNSNEDFQKLQEEHARLQEKIASLKREKEEAVNKLDHLETLGEPAEITELKEIHFKNKLMLAKAEGELSQIDERIQSEYGLTMEELINLADLENVSASKKQTAEMRSRLFELEPVNLLAIEEFKQAKERHALIVSQHDDLASARQNLKTLINELDLKAREVFLQKMEVVTGHFKQIFSELFPGGEAKIELAYDETNDPLLAGIEISTCPSGRKWLPLQALSGGERAMTAIAILFAFLKTNPSPVCILDEVDAPLDDANIGRFLNYLKEISKATQVLIITHNKYTMKAANIIYGITMEEPGISRVISMKLDKFSEDPVAA